jgi:hypothetical protein
MKAPEYFLKALDDMGMSCIVEDSRCIEFTDYRVQLPVDVRLVDRIEYAGTKLDVNSNIRAIAKGKNGYNYNDEFHVNNNWITFETESGSCTLYFRRPALEFDCELQVYFPLIEDIEAIKLALMEYVVMILIRRGYKHPTLDLTSNSPFTNIGLMWEKHRKSAMSKRNPLSAEERGELYRIATTLLANPSDKVSVLYST